MRLFFDECCSPRLPRDLKEFFEIDYPDLQVAHLRDWYNPGNPDSTWLENLKQDGDWIVVTQDSGKQSNKDKLPVICRELGITNLAFGPIVINGGYSLQKRAIVTLWPLIIRLPELQKGSHVRLTIVHGKKAIPRFELMFGGRPLRFDA
jgi:hypothetical protein